MFGVFSPHLQILIEKTFLNRLVGWGPRRICRKHTEKITTRLWSVEDRKSTYLFSFTAQSRVVRQQVLNIHLLERERQTENDHMKDSDKKIK